jgi:hypothetical protein
MLLLSYAPDALSRVRGFFYFRTRWQWIRFLAIERARGRGGLYAILPSIYHGNRNDGESDQHPMLQVKPKEPEVPS